MTSAPAWWPQSPDDILDHSFDFIPDLVTGETLATAAVTASPLNLAVSGVSIAGAVVTFRAQGGTPATPYAVTCQASTSQGRTLSQVGTLWVGAVGLDDPAA